MTDPAWAHEVPEIHQHDPRWSDRADRERERLTELLRPWLVDGVEHVGSTAVPGLAAKPIVDLMASVSEPDAVVTRAVRQLSADGWCFVPPELDQRDWRRFFVKPDPSGRHRLAHLHVIAAGHPRWREQLVFRDALRRDPRLVQRYADLKRRLADGHGDDREAYTEAKTTFVTEVLATLDH
ncbi:MAG: GrpB family protein [Stackebrandtia sp.]